jgi:hypothetical protein
MTQAIALSPVDQLGVLLAQIAVLEKQAEQIKKDLKAQATGTDFIFEGDLFKANVIGSLRSTVDYKTMTEMLGVPEAVIAKYTKVSAVVTLKVTSR